MSFNNRVEVYRFQHIIMKGFQKELNCSSGCNCGRNYQNIKSHKFNLKIGTKCHQ